MKTHEIVGILEANISDIKGEPIYGEAQIFLIMNEKAKQLVERGDKTGIIALVGTPQPDTSEKEYHLSCQLLEWAKSQETFQTVGDLIDYLETLGRERFLMFNYDGNTAPVTSNDICIWNHVDTDSPVAIII